MERLAARFGEEGPGDCLRDPREERPEERREERLGEWSSSACDGVGVRTPLGWYGIGGAAGRNGDVEDTYETRGA